MYLELLAGKPEVIPAGPITITRLLPVCRLLVQHRRFLRTD